MTSIKINGVEREVSSDSTHLKNVLDEIGLDLKKDNQVISKVRIDGRELDEENEKQFHGQTLASLNNIEIETSNPADLAYETLTTLELYLSRVSATVLRTAEMYQMKQTVTAEHYFVKALDGIDLFVQTIGGVKLALRFGLNTKVALVEASLVSIMNDLLDAKRQNNYVFLCELLEKDLIENLNEWKTVVFPIFRNKNSN